MKKIKRLFSAAMAGLTIFSMAPVNAETYNAESVEDEATQVESPETSSSTKISGGRVLDNTISWLKDLFLPKVFAAEDDIASGTSGGVTWVIDSEGTLTLSPTNGVSGEMESLHGASNGSPWYNYRAQIKKVVAEQEVALGENANGLFYECSNLAEIDLSNLDTSNVTNMAYMLYGCRSLPSLEGLESWETGRVTSMGEMFCGCSSLTSLDGLESWDVRNVRFFVRMFLNCTALINIDGLTNWETTSVTNISAMFYNCKNLTTLVPLSEWNTTNVTDAGALFYNCASLTTLSGLETWDLKNNKIFYCSKTGSAGGMFEGCSSLISISQLKKWNILQTDGFGLSHMFSECENLVSLDGLEAWNISNVNGIDMMFNGCENITTLLPVKNWDTSNITNMNSLFNSCSSLVDIEGLSEWKTQKVTSMVAMFNNCVSLTNITPIANWDTNNVTNMNSMFYGCKKVKSADFSNWKTPSNKRRMLSSCSSLSQIAISADFDFINTNIPSPRKTNDYTGNWAYGDPWNHEETLTGVEFKTGTHKAGTWYWERAGESPLRQQYTSNPDNIFIPEYVENADGTISLKQTPEEQFSTDGYWQQSDDNSWAYTFYVYDASVQWYVWEENVPDGYTSSAIRDNPIIIENGSTVPTITNTAETIPRVFGRMAVRKQLVDRTRNISTFSLEEQKFPFKITVSDENNQQLTGVDVYDGTIFKDGVSYQSVSPSEELEISGIPAGYHYTVEELPDDKYIQEIANDSGIIQPDNEDISLMANDAAGLVVATNTRIAEPERTYGNLTLRKNVTGNVNTDESFNFVVSFGNLESETTYTYDNKTFASDYDGSADVEVLLKNGEEITFNNLPTNSQYRILEEAGNYTSSYTITDANNLGMINQTTDTNEVKNEELATATEILDEGESVTVEFTNNIMKTQNVSISKVVKDAEGQILTDDNRYEFTAEFSNTEPGTEIKSDLGILRTDDNGQVTVSFYLTNGDTVKFIDIPVGTQYRFTEAENSATASYKITDTLENQGTVTTEATNDKPKQELSTAMETVDNNEDTQIEFTNIITRGSLTITKKDSNNEPLMGAEFNLAGNDGTVYQPATTATNSEGIIQWNELPLGTYTLTETKSPAGATLMSEPLTIEITSETPDVEISITDNSAVFLDAGGTGLITWITISSAFLALGTAFLLDTYKKKKRYGM